MINKRAISSLVSDIATTAVITSAASVAGFVYPFIRGRLYSQVQLPLHHSHRFLEWSKKYSALPKRSGLYEFFNFTKFELVDPGSATSIFVFRDKYYIAHLKRPGNAETTDPTQFLIFTTERNEDNVKAMMTEYYIHYRSNSTGDVYTLRPFTTRNGNNTLYQWDVLKDYKPSKFDDLPIHSEIRPILDETVEFLKRAWSDPTDKTSRGILFRGEPGSGKTSIAYAFSREIGSEAYKFPSCNSREMFFRAKNGMDRQSVVVFDDADKIAGFESRENTTEDRITSISIGDTLPVMFDDVNSLFTGPSALKGALSIVATNYPNRIDRAVIRRGRMKHDLTIGKCDHLGIKRFMEHRFEEKVPDDVIFPSRLMTDIFSIIEDSGDFEEAVHLMETRPIYSALASNAHIPSSKIG